MGDTKSGLTPEAFVEKWSKAELSERSASQEHFIDLCRLIEHPTPAQADATGEDYCFEKHVKVVGAASKGSKGDAGFVDVWKRGFFAWEYKRKGKHKSLDEAYRQLYQYRDDLDNPPLSVVCDIGTIEIRAHFPGYPTALNTVTLKEIPGRLEVLRRVFFRPESFKPEKTREEITTDVANVFGDLADKLLDRAQAIPATLFHGHGDPVAHFLMKVMFCLFAEDVGLLPDKLFTKLINRCMTSPEDFAPNCGELFEKMKKGGWYGNDKVDYFNGGLFDDAPPLPLGLGEMPLLFKAATRPWQAVEPSVFGTLFERILDPKKRAQIGAHYTSKADILLVIDPVIMTPLRRKWDQVKQTIAPDLEKIKAEPDAKKRTLYSAPVLKSVDELRRHLGAQRILDPACGSGNFLYVALQQLLMLDDEIVRYVKRYDIDLNPLPYIRPTQLHGIEINPYAAELAQVVVWIGYLQWLAEHNISNDKRPILDKLITIENRDAILDLSKPNLPVPAKWPDADFIIGNPPFLGAARIWEGLGTAYRDALWRAHDIARFSDLCCYWFELARRHVEASPTMRVGLLATQAIRGKTNREVLERIAATQTIFDAWADRDWVLDGAAVHVSIVCFTGKDYASAPPVLLNGSAVTRINPDLTSQLDATSARVLPANEGISFIGTKKAGLFNIAHDKALVMLSLPKNPHGKHNRDVIAPWASGSSLTGRWEGMWIIDFGCDRTHAEASLYEEPFKHALLHVKPDRDTNNRRLYREKWWLHAETRPGLRSTALILPRCLAVTRHAKFLTFVWMSNVFIPDDGVFVFARSDDYFFGALQCSIHNLWARRMGTQLEDRPRYTPTTCFETFPLPWPPGKEDVNHPAYKRIAEAAKSLNEQRERWLNPPEWIEQVAAKIDAADTFGDVPEEARALVRQSAIMAAAAKDPRLKKRTLTNLYNERPTWLKISHEQLDRAVLAAYAAIDPEGDWQEDWAQVWTDTGAGQPLPADHPLSTKRSEVDQKVLANLLRLNHARAKGEEAPDIDPKPAAKAAKPKTPKPTAKRAKGD